MSAPPNSTPIRRLVLIRPAKAETPGLRRLLLANRTDALLPIPPRRQAPGQAVRAP